MSRDESSLRIKFQDSQPFSVPYVTVLMPTMSTTVHTVEPAVLDNFISSQQSTSMSNVYHVQDHVLKKHFQIGTDKRQAHVY